MIVRLGDLNVRASCWWASLSLLLLLGAAALNTCQETEEQPKDQSQGWLKSLLPNRTNKSKPKLPTQEDQLTSRADKICHKNREVPVQSIEEMRSLIAVMNLGPNERCKANYMSAVYELDPILKLDAESLCQDKAFQMIKDYHFRFIQPFKRANRRPTQFEPLPRDLVKEQLHPWPRKYTVEFDEEGQVLSAPIAIRHFFLKFALQVSYVCKKNLVSNLRAAMNQLLTENDLEVMQMFGSESPIGAALSDKIKDMDFDSVLYIPELDGKLVSRSGDEIQAGREQYLKTSAGENSALYQMVFTCKQRFKPLYDRLIMPVVRLSKLGYDYRGEDGFTLQERQFLDSSSLKNWLVVMHICEIFKNTHLIRANKSEDPHTSSSAQEKDDEVVSISKEEAHNLELESSDLEEKTRIKFVPINYELTVRNAIDNELMITSERQLDMELARKHGNLGFSDFRLLLVRVGNQLKKNLAKLDMERFAHYRRHSLFYSGLLNFLSSCSNVVSISFTLHSIATG